MTPCICRPNNASKSGSTVLELSHISQRYGRKVVLNDVSQDFGPGVTVITGPSGAGKTTLLRICASAEKPSAGTISWQGKSVASQKRRFRAVLGYAPQRIDFPEDISAMDFLLHIAALKSIGRENDVLIVSVDGGCPGIQNVADGVIGATSQQYPLLMASLGVEAVKAWADTGEKPENTPGKDFFDTGVALVTDAPVDGVPSISSAEGLDLCWG